MHKKDLFLKTENYTNNRAKSSKKPKFSHTMPNLNNKLSKKKYSLNHSKFNHNLLIKLLKKSNLKKKRGLSQTHSKITFNSFNGNNTTGYLTKDIKICYNLNKKFRDLPGLSKFHNLTDEKMNNLIKTEEKAYKLIKSYDSKKSQTNFINNKNIINQNDNETKIYNNRYFDDKNIIIFNNKNDFLRHSIGSKKVKLTINKLKQKLSNKLLTYDSLSNLKNEKEIIDKVSPKIKLIKNNNNDAKVWMASLKNSFDFDLYNRGSKIDRLIFYIEKPGECFEEHLKDKKPGDKYQLFKNQIAKHKTKLDNIIKEMRLNQIKSEYLMKKYIFDLLSRKKKIY